MQLPTLSVILGLALTQTLAAPVEEAPALRPRVVSNLPPKDQFITCPSYLYSRPQAEAAIQHGINKAPKEKNVGGYPHKFGNNKKLVFSSACKGKQLWEFPLLRGTSLYNGAANTAGMDRVVFAIVGGPDKKPIPTDGIYCGVMTHEGVKIQGDFALCPVKD